MLRTVTVTGADDSVKPSDLVAIAREFPFVEFGILHGDHRGKPRFPTSTWSRHLIEEADDKGGRMFISNHLCGARVVAFLFGDHTFDFEFFEGLCVARYQINTHAQPHALDVGRVRRNVWIANLRGKQVIFQYDGVNTNALLACLGRHPIDLFDNLNVAALYDLSHGAGRLPASWRKPLPGVYTGYAGGLSPSNVHIELDKISELAGDTPFWIDAETHLRSDDDRQFDLTKVVRFLETARPYVEKSVVR